MSTTPVRIEGDPDGPSRWMWLVKWLLLIPHYIILVFLWVAFLLLTVVAFVGILINARYPGWIFRFNLGVLRWTWRVDYYGYAVLGTDRYPPFTLGPAEDYPARLDIAEPGVLSRGLVLVKWWLLAIPHYLVLMAFVGGATFFIEKGGDRTQAGAAAMDAAASGIGLVAVLLLIVAIALLFTGRYPGGLFDLLMGIARWRVRVGAYAALMTDSYPPFRLDQGGREPGREGPALREGPPAAG
ncbi:DUF4389 domain-containing protein [Nocardiopsis sp. RSe5-2]|uniref:DUF4389 domain-containing protein n=1 Tax=Nocardiopsis endophytica TaxID=3018445 RepID=A0ABT4TZU9_9ACTN|nr:DUF4389 domain-containing protein [Nocardiopsis endophytica]MDA2810202.1 DUF4389 domain-containing protein [Nocardiopsis endophytica]